MKTSMLVLSLSLCLLFLCLIAVKAGDLGPPPEALGPDGKPISHMKNLNQVEPRVMITNLPWTVTNSGSYYIAMPLTGKPGSSGIIVTTNDVVIDLYGFALSAPTTALHAVEIQNGLNNITVRNGLIRGWGRCGVWGTNCHDVSVVDVKLFGTGWGAIHLGDNALVERCSVYGTGQHAPPATMPPLDDGVRVGKYSTVRDCKLLGNYGCGVFLTNHGKMINCTSCDSRQAEGVNCQNYCTIEGNVCARNKNNGISVGTLCKVVDNTCAENGWSAPVEMERAGIAVFGDQNLIEHNTLCDNYVGLKVQPSAKANLIIRNMASFNEMDYIDNAISNVVGEIIWRTEGLVTNECPWANFRFGDRM